MDVRGEVLKLKNILAPGETEEEMFRRVARHIAQVEKDKEFWEEKFFKIMNEKIFFPNFPTLRNAGRNSGNLAACLVLDIEDSRESIFETLKKACNAQAFGTGTGYNFSKLRPKGALIRSTGGKASGPVSFIRVYDLAVGEIIRQGGVRQGANMGILNCTHPDILEFIKAKSTHKISNFNFSVLVTDEFMKKAINGEEYDLIDPQTGDKVGSLNAQMVFQEICKQAYKTGCPGLFFYDTVNKTYPSNLTLNATNPCGETPLHPGEYCNLGSLNLRKISKMSDEELQEVVRTSIRLLDNIIDVNNYVAIPETELTSKATRKVGLGIMGLADHLIEKGIAYDSEAALQEAERIMKKINEFAVIASEELAEEKGPFPLSDQFHFPRPRRNAQVTNIAPTGTISFLAGCSAGIEPLFGVAFQYKTGDGKVLYKVHDYFEKMCEERGIEVGIEEILKQGGSIQKLDYPRDLKNIFKTAYDIAPEWHVRMQASLQKYVEMSISKTVNLPEDSTIEDVKKIYIMAWKEGCKGITIYRDGTIEDQPIQFKAKESEYTRPKVLQGETERFDLGECGKLYITINSDDQKRIREIFLARGYPGGCAAAQTAALAITISSCLKLGMDPQTLVEKLKQIRCGKEFWDENNGSKIKIFGCAHAIALAIEHFLKRHTNICPSCGSKLIKKEGCTSCSNCSWGKCEIS